MNKTPNLTKLALLVGLAATLWFTGCRSQNDIQQPGNASNPIYETAEQIRAMPTCTAKVVQRGPCYLYLETADGKGFHLGSPGSKADVGHFLDALKDGKCYRFPDVFLKYQMNQDGTKR